MTTMTQQEFITKLKLLTDEIAIKKLSINFFDNTLAKLEGRPLNDARKAVRAAIIETFPNKKESTPGYYFTNQGKGLGERYEHLSLWYLNTNTQLRCLSNELLRQAYFNFCSSLTGDNDTNKKAIDSWLKKANDLTDIPSNKLREDAKKIHGLTNCGHLNKPDLIYKILNSAFPINQPQPTKPATEITQQLTLETMNIESLNLDNETQKNVLAALEHSGLSLPEFIQKACQVYSKTLVGKAKQFQVNLSEISTQDLIIKPELRTLPGRAEELIKRAIRAIHKYNSDCVSSDDERWLISLTSIQSLTGCNTKKLAELAPKFETAIADANASFPNVTAYTNKYRRIKGANISQYVDMVGLVPNGIE